MLRARASRDVRITDSGAAQDALSNPRVALSVLAMRSVMVAVLEVSTTAGVVSIWLTVIGTLFLSAWYPPGGRQACRAPPVASRASSAWSIVHDKMTVFAAASHVVGEAPALRATLRGPTSGLCAVATVSLIVNSHPVQEEGGGVAGFVIIFLVSLGTSPAAPAAPPSARKRRARLSSGRSAGRAEHGAALGAA